MTVSFPTDATELNPIKCKNDKKHHKCSLYDSFTRFQVKIFTFKDRPKFKWIFTKSFHCSKVPNFHAYNLNTCIVKILIKTVPHTKIFMDHFYEYFWSFTVPGHHLRSLFGKEQRTKLLLSCSMAENNKSYRFGTV